MTKWHALSTSGGLMQRLLEGAGASKGAAAGTPSATEAASALGIENASGLTIAKTVALPLLGPLGTAGVVLVFTIFILLSNEDLRDRLVRLVGRQDLHRTILAMNDAAYRLSRYFLFQLLLNGGFGLLIGLCLWWGRAAEPDALGHPRRAHAVRALHRRLHRPGAAPACWRWPWCRAGHWRIVVLGLFHRLRTGHGSGD